MSELYQKMKAQIKNKNIGGELAAYAGQENHDEYEHNLMQLGSERIKELENEIESLFEVVHTIFDEPEYLKHRIATLEIMTRMTEITVAREAMDEI